MHPAARTPSSAGYGSFSTFIQASSDTHFNLYCAVGNPQFQYSSSRRGILITLYRGEVGVRPPLNSTPKEPFCLSRYPNSGNKSFTVKNESSVTVRIAPTMRL